MSEKRVVSANVAIILGLIGAILVINLGWAVASYGTILQSKDLEIQKANSQLNSLNAQYHESLLQDQSLADQIAGSQSVHLWEINFKWEFNESVTGQHFLHFSGTFFNSGNITAVAVKADTWLSFGDNSVAHSRIE